MCAPVQAKLLVKMPIASSTNPGQPWGRAELPRGGQCQGWGRTQSLPAAAASHRHHAHVAAFCICSMLILQYLFQNTQTPSPDNIPGQSKDKTRQRGFASLFAGCFGKTQLGKEPAFSWRQEKCSFQVSMKFQFPQEK